MKSVHAFLALLVITFSAQFMLAADVYAKKTPIAIPEYAKSDSLEKEITTKGKEASSLALTIGVSVLLVAFIIGAILVGTGFKKEMGIMVCCAAAAGGLLMLLAYPFMNMVLS